MFSVQYHIGLAVDLYVSLIYQIAAVYQDVSKSCSVMDTCVPFRGRSAVNGQKPQCLLLYVIKRTGDLESIMKNKTLLLGLCLQSIAPCCHTEHWKLPVLFYFFARQGLFI